MQPETNTLPRLVENPDFEADDSQVVRDLPELPSSASDATPDAPKGSHALALIHWAGEIVKTKREISQVQDLLTELKNQDEVQPTPEG